MQETQLRAFELDNPWLRAEVAEQRIEDIEKSFSWRITQPLRVLAKDLYPLLRQAAAASRRR
jgi:hypothetical protein